MMDLPSSFDLLLDVKDYDQLSELYFQICEDKRLIEDLCTYHGITLPKEEDN